MKKQRFVLFPAAIGLFMSTILMAQVAQHDLVPLTSWPAPQYWNLKAARLADTTSPQALYVVYPDSLIFVPMTPCRVVDTRGNGFTGAFGPPSLVGGAAGRSFPMQSSTKCTIPSQAVAYSLNVTVAPAGLLGYLTIWPTGQTMPLASTLNALEGQVVANAAIVPAGTGGAISAFAPNNTDLIIDINGYYVAQTVNGQYNTALGHGAMQSNIGNNNTAVGYTAFCTGGTGSGNSAVGSRSLWNNSDGNENNAFGLDALEYNTTGSGNVAVGNEVLGYNNTGSLNTGVGTRSLWANTIGQKNVAVGGGALYLNVGDSNIGIGYEGGKLLTSGHDNIMIGHTGYSGESATIRIGTQGTQTRAFIAGVWGLTAMDSAAVMINSNGQLAVQNSSRRFKEDIADMGDASSKLLRLRPVTFRYAQPRADGSKPLDYGLIAEEVAEIYPDLVVRDQDGQIQTVQYQKLTPMLLNEVQRLQAQITALQKTVDMLMSSKASSATAGQ